MTEIRQQVIAYLQENNQYIKSNELKKKLKINGEQQTDSFFDVLNSLVEDGVCFFDEKKGYKLFDNEMGFVYGEIEVCSSGNGFVHTSHGESITISSSDLNGALNGDSVIVSSIDFGKRNELKGEIYKIVKRKTGNIIFKVIGNGYSASLVPYNSFENVPICINKNEYKNLVDGEFVLVKVGTKKVDGEYLAEIDKVIGHKDDADIDIDIIYTKYGIPINFSKEAEEEANNLSTEVLPNELEDRVDLRDKNVITIDCDSTKDRDDALFAEKLPNGNFKLYTNISHVSHYIKRGSKLFEEALNRCTSHYPNNTCNPLFPHKLSNGICSLNEGVDRLTRTCEMEIAPDGSVVDYKIYKSVINSRKAMKYSEVNRILKGEFVEGYEKYMEQLNLLKEISEVLEKAREERNCIDFGINDIELKQDRNGKPKGFVTRGDGEAERIIENCMLITGTTIAEYYSWLPFIYRVHESPSEKSVKDVIKLLRSSNFDIPKYNNIDEKVINSILNKVKDSQQAKVIRTILLESMKRARYDTKNVGHFALQLSKYSHFTSPIRRVADFMIHTLIDELETFNYSDESIEALEKEFVSICEKASSTEYMAKLIEREALAMAMAEYMESHIGEEYSAIVTRVYPHGLFVETDDMISGKVSFENMIDDYYYYNADKNIIIGKNTKKTYQIGNKVCVVVKDASKEARTIDFEIGKQKSLRKHS